jgi:hypothetical protein
VIRQVQRKKPTTDVARAIVDATRVLKATRRISGFIMLLFPNGQRNRTVRRTFRKLPELLVWERAELLIDLQVICDKRDRRIMM